MNKPIIGIGADLIITAGERDRAFVYATYADALRRAGAIPVIIPPQPENAAELLERLDGLLLAGGEDCDPTLYGEQPLPGIEPMHPRRQESDLSLARAARAHRIPTLGVCLGMQMMNVAAGGTLIQDIDSQMATDIQHASQPEDRCRHDVIVEQGTRLAGIVTQHELNVNSSHHQAVKRVGEGLRIAALAPDGVVEGLEDSRHPFYVGVQWHPEDMKEESSASAIFGSFIEAARRYAAEKKQGVRELSPAGSTRSE
ncbi:MAG: gamma-glutamyl-gamma-aminobutyrate hydrolase family protein [Acidobacteriota bacterium]